MACCGAKGKSSGGFSIGTEIEGEHSSLTTLHPGRAAGAVRAAIGDIRLLEQSIRESATAVDGSYFPLSKMNLTQDCR
jgi:hypothetical protein